MIRASFIAAVSLTVFLAHPVHAQQMSRYVQFPTWSAGLPPHRGDAVKIPGTSHRTGTTSGNHTRWLIGGIIGAVTVGGITAVGTSNGICQDSGAGCVVFTGLIGGAVGFVAGALIGGQF